MEKLTITRDSHTTMAKSPTKDFTITIEVATCTSEQGSKAQGVTVRPLATSEAPAVIAALREGRAKWQKDGQPWQPLCPFADPLPPPEYRLSRLFVDGIASVATGEEPALLKGRLERLCARLGVAAGAMAQPVATLSGCQYRKLISALAILSPLADIVLLPGCTGLSVEDWAELARDFAPGPKTLWPVAAEGLAPVATLQLNWQASRQGLNSAAALSRPKAVGHGQPHNEPLPKGVTITTLGSLPEPLRKLFPQDDDQEAAVLRVAGLGSGSGQNQSQKEAPSYDLSHAVAGHSYPAQGWRIVIEGDADVVWGCLAKRRRPQPTGGVVALAAGAKVRWRQLSAVAVQSRWQWQLAAKAELELTQLAPDFAGHYDRFSGAGAALVTGVEFSKTNHNQSAGLGASVETSLEGRPGQKRDHSPGSSREQGIPRSWHKLAQGSQWLRLWREDVPAPGSSGPSTQLSCVDLSLSPGGQGSIAPTLALLASHGIAEPWAHLLAVLCPKLRHRLPMEYYVDLLALLGSES